jgi:hypothetical protein
MNAKYQPSYWNQKGKYQKESNQIHEFYIPDYNCCNTISAELFRCIGRIYYDVYNNGGCNYVVLDYFFRFIDNHLPENLTENWKTVKFTFDQKPEDDFYIEYDEEFMIALDECVDGIIEYIYPKLFNRLAGE